MVVIGAVQHGAQRMAGDPREPDPAGISEAEWTPKPEIGRQEKFLPSAQEFNYDWLRFKGYLGNVGLSPLLPCLRCVNH